MNQKKDKEKFNFFIKLYREKNYTIQQLAQKVGVKLYKAKKWKTAELLLEKYNIKQKFQKDFCTGLLSIEHLADVYNVEKRLLFKYKKELFGLDSLKEKRAYQMHLVGIPSRAISVYLNAHIFTIHRMIRKQKAIINNTIKIIPVMKNKKKQEAISLYQQGKNFRDVAKEIQVNERKIFEWLRPYRMAYKLRTKNIILLEKKINQCIADETSTASDVNSLIDSLKYLKNDSQIINVVG